MEEKKKYNGGLLINGAFQDVSTVKNEIWWFQT